ncbi:S16 family serine protease [Methanoculleus caldifontis]|nr:S16 family serine protease [Methanoculleus sp. Wushi-C6]
MRIREKTLAVLLVLSLVMNVFLLAVVLVQGDGPSPSFSGSGTVTVEPVATPPLLTPARATGSGTASMQAPVVLRKIEPEQSGPFFYEQAIEDGAMVTISAEVVPGKGRVLVQTKPLMGIVFQETANRAVALAADRSRADLAQSDIIFSIQGPDEVSEIDGPSAGALMAILLLSVLEGFPLNESVTVTGTVDETGGIGPVGGVLEKAEAAAASGKTLLVLPERNERMVEYRENARSPAWLIVARQRPVIVDAREFIEENFGIRVVYAGSIDDLLAEIRAPGGT